MDLRGTKFEFDSPNCFSFDPMWRLLIPPIVVVICFVFILWYVSLRGTSSEVTNRVRMTGDEYEGAWRLAVRRFFLRVLEKLAQRSKVFSLRVHNSFHDFLQSVKEKRKMSDKQQEFSEKNSFLQEEVLPIEKSERTDETGSSTSGEKPRIVEQSPAPRSDFQVTSPLRRRSRNEESSAEREQSVSIRPMVSDRIARPEKLKKKSVSRPIEEDMIARIAVNPKDYTTYEALGDFYMERGDIQDAKECYRQVLKLSPVQRMVKIKIRRLEKLLSQK